MRRVSSIVLLTASAAVLVPHFRPAPPAIIPLAEHPRPDFERAEWQNLNGPWQFQFDGQDVGESRGWPRTGLPAPRPIVVPFPWGSPLSGVPDSAPIGWDARAIARPAARAAGGRRGLPPRRGGRPPAPRGARRPTTPA